MVADRDFDVLAAALRDSLCDSGVAMQVPGGSDALDAGNLDRGGLVKVGSERRVGGDGLAVDGDDLDEEDLLDGALAGKGPAGGDVVAVLERQRALAVALGVLREALAVDAELGRRAGIVGFDDVES